MEIQCNSVSLLLTITHFAGIETFNKTLERGEAGDDVGVLLRGVSRDDIKGGTIICAPDSIKSIKSFTVSPPTKMSALKYIINVEKC